MSTSLRDYMDFCLLWMKKKTGVHLGELVLYPAMVRHCLCCFRGSNYAHQTFGLCDRCCADQTCTRCKESYEPNRDSVGRYCPSCWGDMEKHWKEAHEKDPVAAENELRSTIMKALPSLIGCQHA